MSSLANRVIVLTGASRGIGRALASGLAEGGAKLVLCATRASADALRAIAKRIEESCGGEVLTCLLDVTSPEDCEACIAAAVKRFGSVHALVNNAGLGMDKVGPRTGNTRQFYNVAPEVWRSMVDVNVNGPFFMARAVMPVFRQNAQGRIVNVTTSYDTMLREFFTPYGPSKAAVEAMTVAWAKDLTGTGVLVNAVCPGGGVDTRMMPRADFPDRAKLLPPQIMVPPVAWLCSEESAGITGMRIVAKRWDAKLPGREAFSRSAARMSIKDAR